MFERIYKFLSDLKDAAISSPADGQVLTYDGNAQKWKNANAGGGGTPLNTPGAIIARGTDGSYAATLAILGGTTYAGNMIEPTAGGGDFSIQPGAAQTNGDGSSLNLSATSANGAGDHNGGSVVITAGNATGQGENGTIDFQVGSNSCSVNGTGFEGDGSQLTGLAAAQLTGSHTMPAGVLPTSAALLTAAGQIFTGNNSFSGNVTHSGNTTFGGNATFNGTAAINGSASTWHGAVINELYGGTGQSAYAIGDTLYASSATPTLSRLAGNTTTTTNILTQTGTGSASNAPAWKPLLSTASAYSVGTAYTLTTTAAAATFGTTSPRITLPTVGTWLVFAGARATFSGDMDVVATAALSVRSQVHGTGTATLQGTTGTASSALAALAAAESLGNPGTELRAIVIPPFTFQNANTDDTLTVYAQAQSFDGAGSMTLTQAWIVALRIG